MKSIKKKVIVKSASNHKKQQKAQKKKKLNEYTTPKLPTKKEINCFLNNTVGRPTIYTPDMCVKVIQLMAQGKSRRTACIEMGITTQTFWDWTKEYIVNDEGKEITNPRYKPEFSYAVKIAEELSQRWWEETARLNLSNKDFNSTLFMMNMANRFGWTRKLEGKISTDTTIVHKQKHEITFNESPNQLAKVLEILANAGAIPKVIDAEILEKGE